MKAIVAVDNNWAIGYRGDLLVSLPEDQKDTFRRLTLGNTIVFGRKTLETFPGQKLLPGRKNIILSRNPDFKKEGAVVLRSVEDVLNYSREHGDEDIYIAGGAEVYRSLLPFCSEAIVTRISHSFPADAYFPDLDTDPAWEKAEQSDVIHSVKGFDFVVCRYRNLLGYSL